MSDFLRELGYDPARYWWLAGGTFLLWLGSALLPWNPKGHALQRFNRPILFVLLLLVAMFAWRWPALFFYKPVNPDESQFLAGALTQLDRGTLWWGDGTTSGALVVLPLTLLGWVGLPVDFTHGRLIALLLTWGTVCFGYLILRHIHGEQKGRLLVMPLAGLMIFLIFWDFVPYCSELSPLFLCALATWLCVTSFQPEGVVRSHRKLAAGGLILGIIPFSKFQVLPLGAAIGLSTLVWIFRQPATNRKTILRDLFWLLGGTGAGFVLMVIGVWLSGEWHHIIESYVVHNLYYTQARGIAWGSSGYVLSYLTGLAWGFPSFHYGLLALLAIAQLGLRRTAWRPMLLGWSLLLAAYGAVLVPGRLYPHYLLFLSLPLALLVGLQFGFLLNTPSPRNRAVFLSLFLFLGIGSQLIDRVGDRHSLAKLVPSANPRANVVSVIDQLKRPGDRLAVWGWRPEFYVETQLPQATREALTEAQVSEHPQRDYFRTRFLADLQASEPAFLIDSVGPDDYLLKDRSLHGHETFPELMGYVRQHYLQVKTDDSFRLYVRNLRLERQPQTP